MNTGESRRLVVSTGPDARSATIVYIASSGPDSLIDSGKGVVDGRRLELPTSALRMRGSLPHSFSVYADFRFDRERGGSAPTAFKRSVRLTSL